MLVKALLNGKELDHIISFLTQLNRKDPTFDWRFAKNADGIICALTWQTGTIHQHCVDGLLDVAMLDMMKQQMNSAN